VKKVALILVLVIVFALVGAVVAFNSGVFHSTIEQKVSEAAGAKAHLGTMTLAYSWPLRLHVGQSTIEHPLANVGWKSADIVIHQLTAPYDISVVLDQLNVEMKPVLAQQPPAKQAQAPAQGAGKPLALRLALELKNSRIKTPWAEVNSLNVRFEQKLLMKSPAMLHGQAQVRAQMLPVALPLKFDTDSLTFGADVVKTSEFKLSLGGLNAEVQGTTLLQEGRHRWLLDISAKDLSQLPPTPAEFGAKDWKGSIQLHAEVAKDGMTKPWSAEGNVQASNVTASVRFKQEALSFHGPFLLNADGKFAYVNEMASTPGLKASLDVSNAQVVYGDLFTKAPGVAMRAQLSAASDPQKVNLQALDLQLWNFNTSVKGSFIAKAPFHADLQFGLKPVNLQGAEKLLLPLSKSPVQGEVAVSGKFSGPLTDPMKARVLVENFQMKKFMGQVDYEKPGVLGLKGPATADIQGQGEWANEKIKSAQGRGQIDLSQLSLVVGPLRKEARALLQAKFSVRNQGTDILIDQLDLSTFAGNLGLKGKAQMAAVPAVNLNVEARPLNLSELRVAVPSFRDLIPKGNVTGKMQITGKPEFSKPWSDFPLTISGGMRVHLPEYKMVSAPPEPKGGAKTPPPPVESKSFLPDGELTRRLKLGLVVDVDQFVKDALVVKAVHVDGNISAGKLNGQVMVKQVFGGQVSVKNLSVPLLQKRPVIQGTASWADLTIEDTLGFVKPEYKKMAEGKTAGLAEFSTVMPSEEDFMKQLRVRGDAGAKPVTLNSVKIGELINGALGKIPGIKVKPVKVEPLHGQMKAQFELNKSILDLSQFNAVDQDGSEIQMKGKVDVESMKGDLAGTFFLMNPPLTGCLLEGNADNKGRMVIPLAVKGDLLSPSFSIVSDLVTKIGGKALQCESKKLVEKLKTEGKEKLEKDLKKTLKNIFGN
jgi:hypothetical protein